jgi:hypothetical protein
MVYNIWDYRALGLCLLCGVPKNTAFWKLYLFPSSGQGVEDATQLGPLKIVNLTR